MDIREHGNTTYLKLTKEEVVQLFEEGRVANVLPPIKTRYIAFGNPPKEPVQDEVIEVGDIVQGPCDKEGEVLGVECEVLKHGKILTRLGLLGENSICCCNKYLTKDLTLIRKGPKKQTHVDIEGAYITVHDRQGFTRTTIAIDANITYRMELTEEAE